MLNPLPIYVTTFFKHTTWGSIHGTVNTNFWRKCKYKQQLIKTDSFKLDVTYYINFCQKNVSKAILNIYTTAFLSTGWKGEKYKLVVTELSWECKVQHGGCSQ